VAEERPGELARPVRKGTERMKSLTIDVPASLHWRFKLACIEADRTIAEEVLALIERPDRGDGGGDRDGAVRGGRPRARHGAR
jgi:hypothetical protein